MENLDRDGLGEICEVNEASIQLMVGIAFSTLLLATGYLVVVNFERIFKSSCDKTFDAVDVDHSGSMSEAELEIAVLMFFAEINKYVRVKRPSRHVILEYFKRVDLDYSGQLNRTEFYLMMRVMGGNIIGRVMTMVTVTVASPVIAGSLVNLARRIIDSLARSAQGGLIHAGAVRVRDFALGACTREAFSRALPFLNEGLAVTAVSSILVYYIVPACFTALDEFVLRSKMGQQEGSERREKKTQ